MAYDRYESRRGWREPRSRFSQDYGERSEGRERGRSWDRDDDDRGERGFFERAGDEVASWFGDEEAERRRREDERMRGDDDSWRRPRAFMSDEDFGRQPRFRDEGYRRPYTGRFTGRRSSGGGDDRFDRGYSPERGWSERWERNPGREFTGMASTGAGTHDPHYSEWRRRQIDALDRDYDEYRRENQGRFENEFSNWRTQREGKRQLLGQVREHMSVVGSDDEQLGKVDHVRGDRIILTKDDSEDGRHHEVSCARVEKVEGDKVILDQTAAEAKRHFQMESRDRGFFRDEEREEGPHMLNRSFSGTYER
ncbi:MAG TPA: DUF2171 domain-containing protein [Sphingomicrobium sp.]|nr:DUF2171 domain-containing protein [Sphingomicrobium sp.]